MPADDGEPRCAYCGDVIDTRQWHPLGIGTDEDGEQRFYKFCSRACKREWDDGE